MTPVRIAIAALLIAGLAGCASHDLEGGGHTKGVRTTTEDCGSSGRLRAEFGGSGSVDLRVEDGVGLVIYQTHVDTSGGETIDVSLKGSPGQWTATADFGQLQGFSGGWSIDLKC